MWPSFSYFSTVIGVKFSFANSATSANFGPFIVHGMSSRLIKRVLKIS